MSKLPVELWVIQKEGYKAYARLNPVTGSWTCFEVDKKSTSDGTVIASDLSYLDVRRLLDSKGHVIRQDSRVKIKEEAAKYKRLHYGELVIGLASSMTREESLANLMRERNMIPDLPDKVFEMWLDMVGVKGTKPIFWEENGAVVFWDLVNEGDKVLRALGLIPNDDDLLSMFNSATINMAYGVITNPSSKAFVQKSIGIGFFGRVFSK
jgi:hypothetical protein